MVRESRFRILGTRCPSPHLNPETLRDPRPDPSCSLFSSIRLTVSSGPDDILVVFSYPQQASMSSSTQSFSSCCLSHNGSHMVPRQESTASKILQAQRPVQGAMLKNLRQQTGPSNRGSQTAATEPSYLGPAFSSCDVFWLQLNWKKSTSSNFSEHCTKESEGRHVSIASACITGTALADHDRHK